MRVHISVKHSMPQLMISFTMLYQPARWPTGEAMYSQSAWKAFPNTPSYRPAVAILVGNLLAVGGRETSCGGAAKKEVYMYSLSTDSWIYISDLPAPRSYTTATVLSSIEVLVIGGRGAYTCRENTVYQGTLTCTMGAYY